MLVPRAFFGQSTTLFAVYPVISLTNRNRLKAKTMFYHYYCQHLACSLAHVKLFNFFFFLCVCVWKEQKKERITGLIAYLALWFSWIWTWLSPGRAS